MRTIGNIVNTIALQISFMAIPVEELLNGCQGVIRKINIGVIVLGSTTIGAVLLERAYPGIGQHARRIDNTCQAAIVGLISWRVLHIVMK